MEPKPFNLQAPEQIAKEYGGDKQKIAHAMQMGIVDPTAGLLAGMFIDRMRTAATAEQAGPPQTVAQDTFAPQSAPPPAQPPQQQAPGLGGLPVPQQMFAAQPGGVVPPEAAPPQQPMPAMARGGMVDYDTFKRAIIGQESGGRYGVANAQGSGAMGLGQIMPATGRALAERLGLSWRPDLMASNNAEARRYQDQLTEAAVREAYDYGLSRGGLEDAAGYYHGGSNRDMWGPKTRKYMQEIAERTGQTQQGAQTATTTETETTTTAPATNGRETNLSDIMSLVDSYAPQRDSARSAMEYYYANLGSPAERKARKKEDMWEALASFGANLAAGESPYLLQNVGRAAQQTMPAISASRQARRSEEAAGAAGQAQIEGERNTEDLRRLGLGIGLQETGIKAEQVDRELTQRKELAELDIRSRERIAGIEAANRRRIAEIAAQADMLKPSDFEKIADIYFNEFKEKRRLGMTIFNPANGKRVATANGAPASDDALRRIAVEAATWALGERQQGTNMEQLLGGGARVGTAPAQPAAPGNGWGAATVVE